MIIVAICKQTFRWPVPPGWNVLCKWRLGVDASAWSKVCQLHLVVLDQDILSTLAFRVRVREGGSLKNLRFDVSMKDTVFVHMIYWFEDLIHEIFHSAFGKVVPPSFDWLVHVHIHQFKYQCQSASWLITRRWFRKLASLTRGPRAAW